MVGCTLDNIDCMIRYLRSVRYNNYSLAVDFSILHYPYCTQHIQQYRCTPLQALPSHKHIIAMSGRGNYYKEKYGGGGRGRGRGGGNRERRDSSPPRYREAWTRDSPCGSKASLTDTLQSIHRQQYGAYKRLTGNYLFEQFTLGIVHVQSDAYAAPSRMFVRVPIDVSCIPSHLMSNKIRCVALADFLTRRFCDVIRKFKADERASSGGWSGGKGGDLRMELPSQTVLERTSVQVIPAKGYIEARFQVGLPASGRSIEGEWCNEILTLLIPKLVSMSLMWNSLDQSAVEYHVLCVEDQEALRNQLDAEGLCAFVANGSILPRAHGASDKPMSSSESVPFSTPDSLRVGLTLPNATLRGESCIYGMGIRKGVTLLVGGGFHGKSTLLNALQLGVYNHIPGDGREFVVSDPSAMKIRAEDGRPIHALDISPFINNLPFGRSTNVFSTVDASGSTSQASNIMEALEMGTTCLMLDEDTCATNFMYRDQRMAALVSPDKEPITPFIDRIRSLHKDYDVSTIMVIGSCGDYFAVADTVIMMDSYKVKDVSSQASALCDGYTPRSLAESNPPNLRPISRYIDTASLSPNTNKVVVRDIRKIFYGSEETAIDLTALEQKVEVAQINAIADLMQMLSQKRSTVQVNTLLDDLMAQIDAEGLDVAAAPDRPCNGAYAKMRKFELAAAINRWRKLQMHQS